MTVEKLKKLEDMIKPILKEQPQTREELYKIALSTADGKRPQTLKEIF